MVPPAAGEEAAAHRIVLGGAAIPVQRFTMPLANWLHCELVIARWSSPAGLKRYGSPPTASNSSICRYSLR
jgi:hypothetical protein|eukprot:7391850-Prymnesium_polylepis.2